MPFVNIKISKKLDSSEKSKLHAEISAIMPIIPGKDKDNTLLCIEDGKDLFMHESAINGAFVGVSLYKKAPEVNKKEFAAKLQEILSKNLSLNSESCVYLNFMEYENWSANGNYF